jgi:uncharacterized pyridoxal phosphate-containing UPF0001 family protein
VLAARIAARRGDASDATEAVLRAAAASPDARAGDWTAIPAQDAEAARPYFKALRAVREGLLTQGVSPASLTELSMGMSHDFEIAIEEGATMVRIGRALFGSRT